MTGNRGYPAADDTAAEPSTNGFYVGALTVETVVGIVAGFFFGVMLTSFCWLVIR